MGNRNDLSYRKNAILSFCKYEMLPTHLVNEATIWARAIYPMLLLAEKDEVKAWAGIPFYSQYDRFELEGIVDGVGKLWWVELSRHIW